MKRAQDLETTSRIDRIWNLTPSVSDLDAVVHMFCSGTSIHACFPSSITKLTEYLQTRLFRRLSRTRHLDGYHVDGCRRHGRRTPFDRRKRILSPAANVGTLGRR